MNVQKEPAARLGQQAASKTELQVATYPKSAQLSRPKTLIGELLIFGNEQRKEFWWFFESKLRRYTDLRISWGDYE
ncbi:MAG: hypothetical protein GY774_03810 [Planctomycetes bacterium]|nr:hypothetical protein [Planctomycetota bacterium]